MIAIFPTTELPPDTFGTPENMGFLNSDKLVYDPPTRTPQEGIILMTYFTKLGPDVRLDNSQHIHLDKPYSES